MRHETKGVFDDVTATCSKTNSSIYQHCKSHMRNVENVKSGIRGHTTCSLVQNLEVIFHKRYDVKSRVTAIITEHEDHFRRLEAGGLQFDEQVKIFALIKALPSYYVS